LKRAVTIKRAVTVNSSSRACDILTDIYDTIVIKVVAEIQTGMTTDFFSSRRKSEIFVAQPFRTFIIVVSTFFLRSSIVVERCTRLVSLPG
jgi:hypothetical protein